MPVDPDKIAAISRESVGLYRAAEQAILATVTRHLAEGIDAPDWAVTRLGALATLRTTVQRILGIVEQGSATSIRRAIAAAYRLGTAAATADIPAQMLPRDPDAVRARAALAEVPRAGVIENLAVALVEDVGRRHSNVLRHVLDVFRQVITQATAASLAGGITRREASQLAYQRFVDQGVVGFTDARGRTWRLSSYVEMGVRTVTQRAALQGQTDRQQTLGLPFVMVSNEVQECELCRPYEGKVLRLDGGPTGRIKADNPATGARVTIDVKASLDAARAAGFQHPNCRHSVRAYLPGVTRLPEPPTADPAGDTARQRQRAIERHIRRWKEREQAALTPEARVQARAKVKAWQATMRSHLAANPALKRLSYREQIGAGNLPHTRPPAAPALASAPAAAPPPAAAPAVPPLPRRTRATTPPARTENLGDLLNLNFNQLVNRDMIQDVLANVIDGQYAGFTTRVGHIDRMDVFEHQGILAIGGIYDAAGSPIGNLARGFYRDGDGNLVAVHALLELEAEHRGKGFASAFNRAMEVWYRHQGIQRIEVHANIDVGGYTWAAQGFEFADSQSASQVLARLANAVAGYRDLAGRFRRVGDTSKAELIEAQVRDAQALLDRARLRAFGDPGFPSSYEVSQVGRVHDGGQLDVPWIGKGAMLGSDWQGVKLL